MESLRDYSLNITEEQYHALPAWNYSTIARYAREGFASLATLHEPIQPTPSMEFGSLFDCMVTKGMDTAQKEYVAKDVIVPNAEKLVLDCLHETYPDKRRFNDLSLKEVISAADQMQYQTRWKNETRYDKIAAHAYYFDILVSGKKLVSQKDWNDAIDMLYAIKNNEYLSTVFGTENTPDIEYLYQLKFKEDYMLDTGEVIEIKFMPDLLNVNHKEKTILMVDLKTSSMPAWDFAKNFLKFRYDIEAKLYSDGLRLVLDRMIINNPEYAGYVILPYLFVDISRTDKVPVAFTYDQTDISQSEGFSFQTEEKSYTYKNWDKILEEIISYENASASVPDYIELDKPNDLLKILYNV